MALHKPLVLVTGSSGYLGSALVDRLIPDYTVVGLDRTRPKGRPGATFLECDLTSDESVAVALQTISHAWGRQVASCVHLAAHDDFSGEPSPLCRTLTVEGTRRLLSGLQQFDTGQFVFASTHIVMRPAEEKGKLLAERVIRTERGKIPAVILRLAGVYDEETHVVPIAQQMRRIYEKPFESYLFPGNAEHGQAFVHLEDAVECFRIVIARRNELGPYEVFLVAEPDVMSHAELQDEIGELIHGKEWPTIRMPKTVAKAGAWVQDIDLADDHYPMAIDQARRALRWEPKKQLRTTLPEMVSRLLRKPEAWYRTNKLNIPAESLTVTK